MRPGATTCFQFPPNINLEELESTLSLSHLATEILHGRDRVALDAHYVLNRGDQTVAIDTSTEVGKTLELIFFGFARREFGADAVAVATDPQTQGVP
jgi:hypothetical protein